jgi:hypothetical protein
MIQDSEFRSSALAGPILNDAPRLFKRKRHGIRRGIGHRDVVDPTQIRHVPENGVTEVDSFQGSDPLKPRADPGTCSWTEVRFTVDVRHTHELPIPWKDRSESQ